MIKNTLVKIPKHDNFWLDPKSELIYWRKTIKGRRIKKATGTKKISEAKKMIEDFELSLTSDSFKKAKREKIGIKNPRIESIWNDLIDERAAQKAEATRRGYGVSWNVKLKPFWGEKHISDVNERTIRAYENWYLKEFPGMVFFNARKHLKMLLTYMKREGYLSEALSVTDLDTDVINRLYKRKKPFRIYSDKEQKDLMENAVNLETQLALTAYFDTGMRKMELLSRKWEDVDFKKKLINVWSQKNKKWREVPITPRFEKLLHEHKREVELSVFIFPAKRDPLTHTSPQVFDNSWLATKRLIGLRGRARIHDIRHTFATRTAQDGWPIPVACKVLDMSAVEYMRTYVHINEKDIRGWMTRSFGK